MNNGTGTTPTNPDQDGQYRDAQDAKYRDAQDAKYRDAQDAKYRDAQDQTVEEQEQPKNRKPLIIAIIAILVVALCAVGIVGGYWFAKGTIAKSEAEIKEKTAWVDSRSYKKDANKGQSQSQSAEPTQTAEPSLAPAPKVETSKAIDLSQNQWEDLSGTMYDGMVENNKVPIPMNPETGEAPDFGSYAPRDPMTPSYVPVDETQANIMFGCYGLPYVSHKGKTYKESQNYAMRAYENGYTLYWDKNNNQVMGIMSKDASFDPSVISTVQSHLGFTPYSESRYNHEILSPDENTKPWLEFEYD